jgi:hypothetical protein
MKPTQEEIDQILSGYLDDALDASELLQVQEWLAKDEAISTRYAELLEIRDSIKNLFQNEDTAKLPVGFATKVLAAAVTRAHEEGVDEAHPLMLVSEQPFASGTVQTTQVSGRRLIVVALSLAACLLAMIFGFDLTTSGQPRGASQPQGDWAVLPNLQQDNNQSPNVDSLVESDSMIDSEATDTPKQPFDSQVVESIAATDGERPTLVDSSLDDAGGNGDASGAETLQSIAMNAPDIGQVAAGSQRDDESNPIAWSGGAMLVLKLTRSEVGKEDQAIRSAMRSVGIRSSNQVSIGRESMDQLVTQSKSAKEQGDDRSPEIADASVLLLQLSAKQFDQFYQVVWADESGIESLEMSIAFDAPIMKLIDSVRRDPTAIQHEVTTLEVEDPKRKQWLLQRLDQLPSIPLDRSVNGSIPAIGSGEDLQTQVLLLIQ